MVRDVGGAYRGPRYRKQRRLADRTCASEGFQHGSEELQVDCAADRPKPLVRFSLTSADVELIVEFGVFDVDFVWIDPNNRA